MRSVSPWWQSTSVTTIYLKVSAQDIPVTRDAEKTTIVYLCDLPYEVSGDDVYDFFSAYGVVLTVERSVSPAFPSLCDGNRLIKIVLEQSLPYFMSVCGCECHVWYREQPPQCFLCREVGHRAQSCPLSGLCRRCRQLGHRASKSARARDPALSAASGNLVSTSVPADPVLDVPLVSVDAASVPSSAMVGPVSITVDEPFVVVSVPTKISNVPAPAVADPACCTR